MSSLSVDDIHKIREEHYEKTKDLTPKELSESIKKDAEELVNLINEKKKNKKKKIAI